MLEPTCPYTPDFHRASNPKLQILFKKTTTSVKGIVHCANIDKALTEGSPLMTSRRSCGPKTEATAASIASDPEVVSKTERAPSGALVVQEFALPNSA